MSFDLTGLATSSSQRIVHPREIFTSLAGRVHPRLRFEQGEVLEAWFGRRSQRDLLIKQNTGGGKTVVGLLVAQSGMNEGVGPSAYLTPDKFLAAQAEREARDLGLNTTDDPHDSAFQDAKSILVTTLQKMINGRSTFGVLGSGHTPIDVGTVIVDDAHTALSVAQSQFRLSYARSSAQYQELLELFAEELREQYPTGWLDLEEQHPGAVLRVPFWAWTQQLNAARSLLHAARNEGEAKFTWPLVSSCLQLCAVTFSAALVEICPPCVPVSQIPSFDRAARRIYLTATLADDSVLVSDLGADAGNLEIPVTPGRASDMGDRMIFAPASINPKVRDDAIRQMAYNFSVGDRDGDGKAENRPINVVALVPSESAASRWREHTSEVWLAGDLRAGVSRLRKGHVGLVVLVNKYDGIDLPDKACELLVIDGLPVGAGPHDRRQMSVLSGSGALLARQVQKVEQGMGRGVRSPEDHCAIVLLGTDLARLLSDRRRRGLLSPTTQEQVNLSRDFAPQLEDKGLVIFAEALSLCIDRDPAWRKTGVERIAQVQYDPTTKIRPSAVYAREAFDLACGGQVQGAAVAMNEAVMGAADDTERGMLKEQLAAYYHLFDEVRAQQTLVSAHQDNSLVLRPRAGVSGRRVAAHHDQGAAAAEALSHLGDGNAVVLAVHALLDRLTWDPERTDEAEAAFAELGELIGLASSRPEKTDGAGPDVLWFMTATSNAVVELKTGSRAPTIAKKYADQLGGSVRWSQRTYPRVTVMPVLLHPASRYDETASAVPDARCIDEAKLGELKTAVRDWAASIAADPSNISDPFAISTRLGQYKLSARTVLHTFPDRLPNCNNPEK